MERQKIREKMRIMIAVRGNEMALCLSVEHRAGCHLQPLFYFLSNSPALLLLGVDLSHLFN